MGGGVMAWLLIAKPGQGRYLWSARLPILHGPLGEVHNLGSLAHYATVQCQSVEFPRHWQQQPGTFVPGRGKSTAGFLCSLVRQRWDCGTWCGHEASSYLTPLRSKWTALTSK